MESDFEACCYQEIKDTILKANHNKYNRSDDHEKLLSRDQRTILKANHNHDLLTVLVNQSCYQEIKDTILKANHNLR